MTTLQELQLILAILKVLKGEDPDLETLIEVLLPYVDTNLTPEEIALIIEIIKVLGE